MATSGIRGSRSDDHHSGKLSTEGKRMTSIAMRAASGAAASSSLSALSPAFSMVPVSVRRRASAPSHDATTNELHAPNPRKRHWRPRKKKMEAPAAAPASNKRQPAPVQVSSLSVAATEEKTPAKTKPKRRKRQPKKHPAPRACIDCTGVAANVDEMERCLLCTDPIQFYALGECNHVGICSKCSMRMRLLLDDRNCPMCKQPLARVVVSRRAQPYESFQLWDDAAGPASLLDEPSGMIFADCRAHYDDLRRLREFTCRLKRCVARKHSLAQLQEHLRQDHGVEFCELCLTHQSFFIQEHDVFTKSALKRHCINGGRTPAVGRKSTTGKHFHPMCQFCQKRYYGDKELYEHLERDHFKCHLCKVDDEYFRNYLGMRFVVFPNVIEYHAHMSSTHGVYNRVQLNFQVARSGGNPVSGPVSTDVPDRVPDHWNYGVTDQAPSPLNQLEEAFPALPTPSTSASLPVLRPAIVRPLSGHNRNPPVSTRPRPTPPRGQICRNQRLAQALGVTRPGLGSGDIAAFEEEMKTPTYSTELVDWGKANMSYLTVVERRLERIVQEPSCHSVSLRVMSGDERALMHQLALVYGVVSESFGEDPRRRVSFFKSDNAYVPTLTLSAYISTLTRQANAARALTRLKFLPLRSDQVPAEAAQVPPPLVLPANRGWEHIESRSMPSPAIVDAWSDDEAVDDGPDHVGNADSVDILKPNQAGEEKSQAANDEETESAAMKSLTANVATMKVEEEWEQLQVTDHVEGLDVFIRNV
ncbi:hypothetical protein PsorP6_000844 [Peronosclerospora sorghi]|uniref:Uncharacterized protein n=1 Tax=Peronosclerospora sorghi TaxID=230839 RepID=A0ACC0WRE3_9STRA|nr:hypothetical protein PsorP6_000844 [Peronosclerospora sorghi]